ncbi:MAG: hypothetical protein BWY82_00834 [Verrucomicrobia bacterium ADurb.Bin474]|nr:MAG: hypothetical protein BWY82_00834 [Verrucomicrobia bacterium ADurb.Bin474]
MILYQHEDLRRSRMDRMDCEWMIERRVHSPILRLSSEMLQERYSISSSFPQRSGMLAGIHFDSVFARCSASIGLEM